MENEVSLGNIFKVFSTFSVIILLDHLNNSNQLTNMGGA